MEFTPTAVFFGLSRIRMMTPRRDCLAEDLSVTTVPAKIQAGLSKARFCLGEVRAKSVIIPSMPTINLSAS
jgi:hypothetical protein